MTGTRLSKGFSLAEVMVALFLTLIVGLIFYSLLDGTLQTGMFVESHGDLAVFGQRVVNQIQTEVHQSKQLFQDDTDGNNYRNAMQLPADLPVWEDAAGSRLPVFNTATSDIVPDGDQRHVGNCLLIARQFAPISIDVDRDGDGETDGNLLADSYRFQFYYLSRNTRRSFRGAGFYLDLVEARSYTYADYFQLSTLDASVPAGNPLSEQVIHALRDRGILIAWDPGHPYESAFHALASDDSVNASPLEGHDIAIQRAASLFPDFRGGRISGNMDYSIAFRSDPRVPLLVKDAVPKFARVDEHFPEGLEFLIVGPPGSRKVYTRIVLLSNYRATKVDSQENFVITSSRS